MNKKEMKEELDILLKTLNEVNPQIIFREKITGINPIKEAETLISDKINQINSFEDYYYLVRSVLCCMQDLHCKIYDIPTEMFNIFPYIDSSSFTQTSKYIQDFDRFMFGGVLDLKLINEQYYIPYNLYAIDENKDTCMLPAGSKVLKINDLPLSFYEKLNYKSVNSMRWDNIRNIYYSNTIFHPDEYGIDTNLFVLAILPNKEKINVNLNNKQLFTKGIQNKDNYEFKVVYFEDSVLYLRIPEMDLSELESVKKQILKHKNKYIRKLIIDIRNNQGGNDKFWIELLTYLINEDIHLESKLIAKNSNTVKQYLSKIEKIDTNNLKLTELPFKLNDKYTYLELNDITTIRPNNNSLNYTGKIFLLSNENTYSSALAFVSATKKSNKFIRIGQNSGRFGGRGCTPFLFSLPYSKIVFSIEPILDITNVETLQDIMQNNLDVEIKLDIQDYITEYSYQKERYDSLFLYHYDKTYKYIIDNL